jgi:hypothetical protein
MTSASEDAEATAPAPPLIADFDPTTAPGLFTCGGLQIRRPFTAYLWRNSAANPAGAIGERPRFSHHCSQGDDQHPSHQPGLAALQVPPLRFISPEKRLQEQLR